MRSLRTWGLFLLALSLGVSSAIAQDWRGGGRVTGFITDENGQPVPDAMVKLSLVRANAAGPSPIKANKKGFWAAQGLADGAWNLDITAPGYQPRQQSITVVEGGGALRVDSKLQKSAAPPPPAEGAAPVPEKNQGAEVVAAVNEGNRLLGEKKYPEARAEYEKALAILPDNAALWKGVAQTYHGEGNKEKTIEALQKTTEFDPNDADSKVLLASMLIDAGKLDEGKTALDGLPPGAVKDPAVYINIAIIFMNKNKPQDSVTYLTKAVELDATQPDPYYYRGLANIQMKKNADAKADFQKYLQIAPNGSEAKEVQEMLQALK